MTDDDIDLDCFTTSVDFAFASNVVLTFMKFSSNSVAPSPAGTSSGALNSLFEMVSKEGFSEEH